MAKKPERKRAPFIRRGAETNDVFLEDLRGAVWNSVKTYNLTWNVIAIKADITVATVAKFAYGETKRPQFRTVYRIAEALELPIKAWW